MRQLPYRALRLLLILCAVPACSMTERSPPVTDTSPTALVMPLSADNPLAAPSPLELEYPPFDLIEPRHYMPAFEAGMAEQQREIDAIAGQPDEPTIENTLIPLEQSGRLLDRVSSVFFGLVGAHTNDELKAIQVEIAPRLSAHSDATWCGP